MKNDQENKRRLVGKMKKNARENIEVNLNEFKGTEFVDIRVWFNNEEGEWFPSKRGVSIKANDVPELISILKKSLNDVHPPGNSS